MPLAKDQVKRMAPRQCAIKWLWLENHVQQVDRSKMWLHPHTQQEQVYNICMRCQNHLSTPIILCCKCLHSVQYHARHDMWAKSKCKNNAKKKKTLFSSRYYSMHIQQLWNKILIAIQLQILVPKWVKHCMRGPIILNRWDWWIHCIPS